MHPENVEPNETDYPASKYDQNPGCRDIWGRRSCSSVRLKTRRLKRGGDIDLLIQSNTVIDQQLHKASLLAARLQLKLGEQKFDIVVKDAQTADSSFYSEASRTATLL